MKKILAFLILGVMLFPSCDDMIEVEPENSVTFYNYFKTEKDMEALMNNMHHRLREDFFMFKIYPFLSGVLADKVSSSVQRYRDRSPGAYYPTGGTVYWTTMYQAADLPHMIIDNIDKVDDLTEERKDFYLGQSYFVRAFLYFKLAQIWGDVPVIRSIKDVGPKAKTPWREVIKLCIEDAEKAAKMLKPWNELVDADGNAIQSKQIAGKGSAYALLAHMCAWLGEFGGEPEYVDKAITYASYVIDGNLEENYSSEFVLEDVGNIATSVMMGESQETIFEEDLIFEEASDPSSFKFMSKSYTGWPVVPLSTMGSYKYKHFGLRNTTVREMYADGDKRRDEYFYKFDELENEPVLDGWAVVYKRREGIINVSTEVHQFVTFKGKNPVYRLSDIILLRAECYAKKGNDGLAINDLNTVRARSSAPLYNASEEEGTLYYRIFKEREKELLFEKHRWFDCLRTGFWKTELGEAVSLLTDQEVEDGALFDPVNESAFTNNPLMTQNKYWLSKW